MIRIVIIGSGNLSQHLIGAIQTVQNEFGKLSLVQVYSRKKEALRGLIEISKVTNELSELVDADLYILAVSDVAIAMVSDQLPFKNKLVVHASGSFPMEKLSNNNRKGVFYPLQTFTKGKKVDFKTIPICLETENEKDYQIITTVANQLSNKVFRITTEQRKALHVAAVFVNNFTNHLYQLGSEICQEHQVPFEILTSLIQETAQKIATVLPKAAQTGPASRADFTTIAAQEAFLTNENQLKIYKILTQSIQNNGKKL